jgi:cystathionine beta-lyase/cystathionine gamma-synthase
MEFETLSIHAGQEPDPTTGAVMTPIYQTSTFTQLGVGRHRGYEYARTGNPTRAALEKCLAALENAAYGLAFASGMAAIDAVLRLLPAGAHILAGNDIYGGTYRLFERLLRPYGLDFSYVDTGEIEQVAAAIKPNTRMLWLETPTNPLLGVSDIRILAEVLHSRNSGAWLVVDNTFATPFLQRPLDLGADLVVHSTTKYLGGHSDVIGGAVLLNQPELGERLAFIQNAVGAVPGPLDCFLVLRGVKTLPLRMERHSANAAALAEFLVSRSDVAHVIYPFHPSHPQYELACRQMRLGGGMLSFIMQGGATAARRLAERTRLFSLAESLGGVESLIEVPAAMTHASTAQSPLAVDPGLVRLSVGLEHVDDLLADLRQALGQAGSKTNPPVKTS